MNISGYVTLKMMDDNNMTRIVSGGCLQLGIPNDGSLHWKSLDDLEDSDFDKIEEYFNNLNSKEHGK